MEVEAAVQETLDWLGKICSMTVTMQEEQSHLQHGIYWHSGTLDDSRV